MSGEHVPTQVAPLWGELRYTAELLRLLAREGLRRRRPAADAQPLLLIPGFMAGDSSLSVLRGWLERRGHSVSMSGMRVNADCAERLVSRLQLRLRRLADEAGRPVVLIGQSRGGALARCLAVREPHATAGLVMLGSPVCDPLAVSAPVLQAVSMLAWLGDRGLPGMFSSDCRDGHCCARARADLKAPLAPHICALAVYSRSDGIVDWRACLDPHAEAVEVRSSHCGMNVHPQVFELLAQVLDEPPAPVRAQRRAARRRPPAVSSAAEAIG
jgi:pimeloyl-ACP methyl ester carboxylesterase